MKIKNIIVNDSLNDCLDVSYGIYEIDNLNVSKCGDKGLSVGENSRVNIKKLKATNVDIGLSSKDNAKTIVDIFQVDITKNCVSAYNKKNKSLAVVL